MGDENWTGIVLQDCQIVESISSEEWRDEEFFRSHGVDALEGGNQDQRRRTAFGRKRAHRTASERATYENDAVRVDVLLGGQHVVSGDKDFRDTGLRRSAFGPPVTRVFHQQYGESQTGERRHFFVPVVDEFRVAVSENDRRRGSCVRFGRKQPGLRSAGARSQPDALKFGPIRRGGRGRRPDQVARKNEAALHEEEDRAVD